MSRSNKVWKTILNITAGVGLTMSGFYLMAIGLNKASKNHTFNSENISSVTRGDGIFGSTELDVSREYDWGTYTFCYRVSQDKGHDDITLYDGGVYGKCDGLVDKILKYETTFSSLTITELERSKDYNTHQSEFLNADKKLSETVDRLGKYIKPFSSK